MIYSLRVQPEVSKSHIHKMHKNNGLIFHMGKVLELWCKTINLTWKGNSTLLKNCLLILHLELKKLY